LSLRANDTNADDGVLPKTGASIVMLKNAKHIELCDRGTLEINKEMADLILPHFNRHLFVIYYE
jgi:hypothetical protein